MPEPGVTLETWTIRGHGCGSGKQSGATSRQACTVPVKARPMWQMFGTNGAGLRLHHQLR
ncbi:MAG: hypothetical protein ACYCZT_08475 [Thiobacillus sp.]